MSKAALCTLLVLSALVLWAWLSTTRWRVVKWQLIEKPLKRVDFNKPWKEQL